jgi:hypothetical protein
LLVEAHRAFERLLLLGVPLSGLVRVELPFAEELAERVFGEGPLMPQVALRDELTGS